MAAKDFDSAYVHELSIEDVHGKECALLLSEPDTRWTKNVLYFPGDTQELTSVMECQRSQVQTYSRWSYERTASILHKRFPDAAVWIVKPYRMLRGIFGCYEQFVHSTMTGVPEYDSGNTAVLNLYTLLTRAVDKIKSKSTSGNMKRHDLEDPDFLSVPLILVGFSKGCVVLNQLMYEVGFILGGIEASLKGEEPMDSSDGTTPTQTKPRPEPSSNINENERKLIERISAIFWLDSGHSGLSGAWVTHGGILSVVAKLSASIHVHVTPQQVEDPHRPWIREELRIFVELLKKFDANVSETLHFDNIPRSLHNHFKVLKVF